MENEKSALLGEINQLLSQYRVEVPGGRRAWPESIKSRVLELRNHGLNFTAISRQAGIPYFTVLKWQKERKQSGFDLVSVVPTRNRGRPRRVATVTVARRREASAARLTTATVTVTTSKGIRIEGIYPELLLELVSRLEGCP